MRAILVTIWLICMGVAPVAAQNAASAALGQAFEQLRAGDWDGARSTARRGGAVTLDIIDWHYLRAGRGAPGAYPDFVARNGDWPGLPLLLKNGEKSIVDTGNSGWIRAYFADQPPQTGTGVLAYARALTSNNQRTMARDVVKEAWKTMVLTQAEHDAFIGAYSDTLAGTHEARLDHLIWQGHADTARMMFPLVDARWQASSRARLGLRAQVDGVDALIEAVPADFQKGAGLAYERFEWRARKGRSDGAIELMLERGTSLGQPEKWGSRRRTYARAEMREGNPRLAYQIASKHGLSEGSNFADLEWLSGYLALTYLNDPRTALAHFKRFRGAVATPISLGRAGYWEGRAYEKLGDRAAATAAYTKGAQHQSSFYGQLSAEKVNAPMDIALLGGEDFGSYRGAAFLNRPVVQAAILLHHAGEDRLSARFFAHIAETMSHQQRGQLAALALDLDANYAALLTAKRAIQYGDLILDSYFPMSTLVSQNNDIAPEFALAIARRESEFLPTAQSGVGARGLMQLMPGTAQDMAKKVGTTYSATRLFEPAYNARLGTAYLRQLSDEFGGNPVLISVAYNAGPTRARRWANGNDPRSSNVDVIDWIEHIPFRETRNYVMRVTESLGVYRAKLAGQTQPWRLSDELKTR